MIGKKVRVFWPVDERWYTGTVQKYDSSSGEHLLEYQDGDNEWVKIGENNTNSSGMDPMPPSPMAPADNSPGKHVEMGHAPPYGPYPGPPAYHPPPPPGVPYGAMPPSMPPYGMYPSPYGAFSPGHGGPNASPPDDKGDINSPDSDGGGAGKRKTGPKAWTKEEDALLLNIVTPMQMPLKWSIIAQSFPDRTGKQCRERYVNHLNPRLKVTDWNAFEDAMIFHLYNSIGSHWAKMSKIIPGRTDNGIKNRFHNLRRQFEREDEHRLRLSSTDEFEDAIRLDRIRKFPEKMAGKSLKLWDMHSGIAILAAQSILGSSGARNKSRFGPFRPANDGDICARCGLILPSLQTGDQVCDKSGWCQACTRIPPHVSSNLLRECLNLRREQDAKKRSIVESWEEYFSKDGKRSNKAQKTEV